MITVGLCVLAVVVAVVSYGGVRGGRQLDRLLADVRRPDDPERP